MPGAQARTFLPDRISALGYWSKSPNSIQPSGISLRFSETDTRHLLLASGLVGKEIKGLGSVREEIKRPG